jgi:hypothetical protein
MVGGQERVVGDLVVAGVDGFAFVGELADRVVQPGSHLRRECSRCAYPGMRCRNVHLEAGGVRIDVGPVVDIGERVGIVRQPGVDPDATGADGDQRVAILVDGFDLQHLGDRADRGPVVATARLPSVRDEHLAELGLAVVAQAVAHHVAVARLEHVERQDPSGEQHRTEREHPHHAHDDQRGPRSAGSGAVGWTARRSASALQNGT